MWIIPVTCKQELARACCRKSKLNFDLRTELFVVTSLGVFILLHYSPLQL